jgi:hypothetical protein
MRSSEYAQQSWCRPGPEITYFARARTGRPIARPPSSVGGTMLKSFLPRANRACTASPTRQVILAQDLAAMDASVPIDARRDVRPLELSKLRRAEGSISASSSRHRTELDTASALGTDAPEWQPAFSGRPLSIFRVWFGVSSDASMSITHRAPLPVGPLGGALPISWATPVPCLKAIQPMVSDLGSPPGPRSLLSRGPKFPLALGAALPRSRRARSMSRRPCGEQSWASLPPLAITRLAPLTPPPRARSLLRRAAPSERRYFPNLGDEGCPVRQLPL